MGKRAVVVIDMQNDYLTSGRFPLVGVENAVAHAAKVIAAARAKGEPVINVRHDNGTDAPFFATGTEGAEIIEAVLPAPGETVLVKSHPNAFRETDLEKVLDAQGIEEVVIVGAMSHVCIDATARAAADLGYGVVVVHDAVATLDLEFGGKRVQAAEVHAAFMSAIAFAYGTVSSTDELLSQAAAA